jgi:hypothetical protein
MDGIKYISTLATAPIAKSGFKEREIFIYEKKGCNFSRLKSGKELQPNVYFS